MKTSGTIPAQRLILSGLLLALALAAPAGAVDTLDVKATVKGPWTIYSFGKAFSDASFPQGTRKPCVSRDGSIWWGFYGGVEKGALRYDGKTWMRYTARDGLMDGEVRSIAQSADGTLYFAGSHRGKAAVTRYDGRTWLIYTEADGLSGNYVGGASAVDAQGNLWLTTEITTETQPAEEDRTKGGSGVLRFDPSTSSELALSEAKGQGGKTFRNFEVKDGLAHNRVYDIAAGPDGSVWFATFQGVSRFDGKTRSTHSTGSGQAGSGQAWTTSTPSADPRNYDILVAQDGKVWCTHGQTHGISVFDGTTWKRIGEADGMPEGRVLRICQAQDGAIWFGTHQNHLKLYGTKGLLRYQDGAWLRILKEDGLPGDNVHSIVQSRDGSLYLTVPDVGIVRYRPDFTGLGTISGTVKKPDGSLWVGVGIGVEDTSGQARAGTTTSEGGRYHVRAFPGTYRVLVRNSYGAEPVKVIVEAEKEIKEVDFKPMSVSRLGRMVPAGRGKVVSAGPGKVVSAGRGKGHLRTYDTTDGLSGVNVVDIFEDREGHLWFITYGVGVSRYDGQTFTTFTTKDGLAHNKVQSIFQDLDGNLWFGTYGSGVSRYDDKAFTTFTTKDGLANNMVLSIIQDREGNLWFSTNGGVSRYDGKTWTTFTTKDGLPTNGAFYIFQDREGNLWFSTGGGVSRYNPSTSSGESGNTFTTFTTKDGLANNATFGHF